jgi:hypothetical protein
MDLILLSINPLFFDALDRHFERGPNLAVDQSNRPGQERPQISAAQSGGLALR